MGAIIGVEIGPKYVHENADNECRSISVEEE
jgi:hypothetical protein